MRFFSSFVRRHRDRWEGGGEILNARREPDQRPRILRNILLVHRDISCRDFRTAGGGRKGRYYERGKKRPAYTVRHLKDFNSGGRRGDRVIVGDQVFNIWSEKAEIIATADDAFDTPNFKFNQPQSSFDHGLINICRAIVTPVRVMIFAFEFSSRRLKRSRARRFDLPRFTGINLSLSSSSLSFFLTISA